MLNLILRFFFPYVQKKFITFFKKGEKERKKRHPLESPKAAYSKIAGMATDKSPHTRHIYMFFVCTKAISREEMDLVLST